MNCGACGTRVGTNERVCPNCGRNLKNQSTRAGGKEGKVGPLAPSSAKVPTQRSAAPKAASPKTSGGGAPAPSMDRRRDAPKRARTAPPPPPEPAPDLSAADVEVDTGFGEGEIRALLFEMPDRLEDGLSIYTDENAEPVGIDFATQVGIIDLLARDDAGGLVVVLVTPCDGQGDPLSGKDLVSTALERVGWVRKHVAQTGQEVRSIVLVDVVPEDLSYTAAAVAETVSFKRARLEVSFFDVEI